MHDILQQALQSLTYSSIITQYFFAFFANGIIYLLLLGTLTIYVQKRKIVTWDILLRVVLLCIVSFCIAKIASHMISDPRPFMEEHFTPVIHVSSDNGFPSDHTLLAAALVGIVSFVARKRVPLFVIGLILVIAGRLGIGAHHTLDILGSLCIVAIVYGLLHFLPQRWTVPIYEHGILKEK